MDFEPVGENRFIVGDGSEWFLVDEEMLLKATEQMNAVLMDPLKTTILGNFESSYKTVPVALDGYPWFARTFMRPHIEIENDAAVWDRIEALIGSKVL